MPMIFAIVYINSMSSCPILVKLQFLSDPETLFSDFFSLNSGLRHVEKRRVSECTLVSAHFVDFINFQNAKQKFKSSSNNGVLLLWKGFRKGVAAKELLNVT